MSTFWSPPDIGQICAEQNAHLTQCSQTGFMFLALVAQLFGGSNDKTFPGINPYSEFSSDVQGVTNPFFSGITSQAIETSILGPTQTPLGPVPIKPLSPDTGPFIGPIRHQTTHLGQNGKAVSHSTFFFKPEFGFGKVGARSKPVDFKFLSQRGYFDALTADSKKAEVTVDKEEKMQDKKKQKRHIREEYDFIIVGAGSAGCVLANRLSEVKKWKILLIEAGPEEPDVTMVPAFAPLLGGSSIDWNYRTQPEELTCRAQRGRTCAWLRGKSMGGSSAINYMVYMRGNKRDYDKWAELGNHGWSYSEVLPYFKKSEDNHDIESHDKYYHSVGGPLHVERFPYIDINTMMIVQGFKEKGLPIIDLTGPRQVGVDIGLSTSKNGRRFSANTAYIKPIRHKRHNLHILKEAYVTKIIIDPVTKAANGVEFLRHGYFETVFAKKEVIVSAGSLNSPKLLMLSGIGPKFHLENSGIPVIANLKVGYNLQDHVTTDALIITLSNKTSTMVNGEVLLESVYDYFKQQPKKNGPLASTNTLSGIGFITTEFEVEERNAPDIQFHFDGRHVRDFYSDPTNYLATNIFPLSFYDGIAARPLLLTPKSRGYLLLNHTDPVFGPPLIYSGFFTVKEDVDRLVSAMRFAVSLEETAAFRAAGAHFDRVPVPGCEHHPWGTYEYFECLLMEYTSTIYHPVGTCKMGPIFDKDAVIDPRLRVYGVKKLRVIDSSIMPYIIRGNTNAPTMMIAEKGADYIKEDWIL